MSSPKTPQDPFMELSFTPDWVYIAYIRRFVHDFLRVSIADGARVDQITMAVSELAENAVKYTDRNQTKIRLSIKNASREVAADVCNHCTEEMGMSLLNYLETLNRSEPLNAYLSQMLEGAEGPALSGRLGLARVRYEAGAELAAHYGDDTITMHALFSFNQPIHSAPESKD